MCFVVVVPLRQACHHMHFRAVSRCAFDAFAILRPTSTAFVPPLSYTYKHAFTLACADVAGVPQRFLLFCLFSAPDLADVSQTDTLPAPDQVETSSNLASVKPAEEGSAGGNGTYEILCSTRSSLSPPLEAVRRRIKTAAELCGASDVLRRQAYPGWQPDLQSNVLKVTKVFFLAYFCGLWRARNAPRSLASCPPAWTRYFYVSWEGSVSLDGACVNPYPVRTAAVPGRELLSRIACAQAFLERSAWLCTVAHKSPKWLNQMLPVILERVKYRSYNRNLPREAGVFLCAPYLAQRTRFCRCGFGLMSMHASVRARPTVSPRRLRGIRFGSC